MKALFYYFFGIISALYLFVIMFDKYAPVYLDDYYVDSLVLNYSKEWYYSNITVSSIAILFIIVWIYRLGKSANHEKREPLLINKEEENE